MNREELIPSCPACENILSFSRPVYTFMKSIPSFQIYECSCGMRYSSLLRNSETFQELYCKSYFTHPRYCSPEGREAYRRHLRNIFLRGLRLMGCKSEFSVKKKRDRDGLKRKRLLDIGAATGEFVELACELGFDAAGVDFSQEAVRIAKGLGREVRHGDALLLEKIFYGEYFDVITMWDVVEHIPDPALALMEAMKRLVPGGILLIKTISTDSLVEAMARLVWWLSPRYLSVPLRKIYVPGHLFYFRPSCLLRFLEGCGETVFLFRTDTPSKALSNSSLIRTCLDIILYVQAITGLTYELVAGIRKAASDTCRML